MQVIIDSQPLTVAVLAALLFGESIGVVGSAGLVLGVLGLLLLEVFFPFFLYEKNLSCFLVTCSLLNLLFLSKRLGTCY